MIAATAYMSEICRLYVAVLFLLSATGKTFAFREFESTIAETVQLPARLSRFLAAGVIAAEAIAALASALGGRWAQFGVAWALLLSIVFTGFVATMLAQGKSVRCNCFGQSDDRLSPLDLVRNGFLLTACAFYLFNGPSAASISIVAYLLLLAPAAFAFLISANLKDIVAILRVG
jgi:hypothetical protein